MQRKVEKVLYICVITYIYSRLVVKSQYLSVMCMIKSYSSFVSDEGVPDACHGLSDAQVGIKLVPVETGH